MTLNDYLLVNKLILSQFWLFRLQIYKLILCFPKAHNLDRKRIIPHMRTVIKFLVSFSCIITDSFKSVALNSGQFCPPGDM